MSRRFCFFVTALMVLAAFCYFQARKWESQIQEVWKSESQIQESNRAKQREIESSRLNALQEALAEGPPATRIHAAKELATKGMAARIAVPKLIEVVRNDSDESVRKAAADALVRIDKAAAVETLELAEPDSRGRRELAIALATTSDTRAFSHLLDAMRNESRLRHDTLEALKAVANSAFVPELVDALNEDGPPHVHIAAASLLGDMRAEASVSALTSVADSPVAGVRFAARKALALIKGEKLPQLRDFQTGDPATMIVGLDMNASAISGDGSVIVGWQGRVGVRYPIGQSIVAFDGVPEGKRFSVRGVSTDGSVIVGGFISDQAALRTEPILWTAQAGFESLGELPEGRIQGMPSGISADGEVVCGNVWKLANRPPQAFVWTRKKGTELLPTTHLGRQSEVSQAFAISADGSVIVGLSDAGAFRWTKETGTIDLGATGATSVSADGTIIVVWSFSSDGQKAFRWTGDGGLEALGGEGGFVSADGSRIVGWNGGEIALWQDSLEPQPLVEVLTRASVDASLWSDLGDATGVSADGTRIVGNGIDLAGQRRAWFVDLE